MAHAILSASGAHWWLNCTPSARLELEFDDVAGEAALEGTAAHELAEHKLRKALKMRSKKPTSSYDSDEMDLHTDTYVEFVLEQIEVAKATCADPLVLIEQRLDFSEYVPEGFGTGDCVIVSDGTLHVIDFKYGLGVLVESKDNPQMMLYGLGALGLFDAIYDIETIAMTIYQPRHENISTHTMSKEALLAWAGETLKPKADLAFAGEGLYVPGEWCRFCRAAVKCRARSEEKLKMARFDFKKLPLLTDEEVGEILLSKGEVMLTIMASLAQQESQSLSQNVKLGIQYRYQKGQIQVNHNRFLGYTKDEDKRLVIVPEEAEIIKRIFREYLEGSSLQKIGKGLQADGILTAAKKPIWRPETVRKILKNEKYIGDALLQKTYTVDFLSKKRVTNDGIVPQYYVANSHDPIISREVFQQVQIELKRRSNMPARKNGAKRQYSSRYSLSGVVYCAHCGEIYRRVHWNNRGCKSIVWRCLSRLEGKDCSAITLNEEVLHKGIVQAINQALGESYYKEALEQNIHKVLKNRN